jgi:hypothetical protein
MRAWIGRENRTGEEEADHEDDRENASPREGDLVTLGIEAPKNVVGCPRRVDHACKPLTDDDGHRHENTNARAPAHRIEWRGWMVRDPNSHDAAKLSPKSRGNFLDVSE